MTPRPKNMALAPEERLEYHKKHSRPLMDQMFDWMAGELNLKNVEPNSSARWNLRILPKLAEKSSSHSRNTREPHSTTTSSNNSLNSWRFYGRMRCFLCLSPVLRTRIRS